MVLHCAATAQCHDEVCTRVDLAQAHLWPEQCECRPERVWSGGTSVSAPKEILPKSIPSRPIDASCNLKRDAALNQTSAQIQVKVSEQHNPAWVY